VGIIKKFGELRMKDPVDAELHVVGISAPDPTATSNNYRMDGVVSGPGITPTAVVHHGMASVSKWPSAGDVLPVTADRAKPERLVVHWERLETGRQQAVSAAQLLAEQMRAGGVSGQPGVLTFGATTPTATQSTVPPPPPVIASAADILLHGTPGLASVIAVFPSAEVATKPAHTMVGLQLRVDVPGYASQEVQNLYGVPNAMLDRLFAGATLPIKAVLSTPGMVAVDWEAIAY
jgi:hypothetical protein